MNIILLTLTIFGVFAIFAALFMLSSQSKKRKNTMARALGVQTGNKKSKVNVQDQRRSDLARKLKEEKEDDKKSKKNNLQEMFLYAGLDLTVKRFWLYSCISCAVFTLLCVVMGASTLVTILVSITAFLGLPKSVLKFKIKKRQKLFMADFADALESMMRLLQAGMPVSEAIRMVAREFGGPMGQEMEMIYEQQKIGVPLPEAVQEAANRMPLTEMQMFSTAITIQTQTGSSLSEVLANLALVIRSRFKLRRKVKALSSEAKTSAGIIASLPVVVAGSLYLLNPEYMNLLFTTSTGKFLVGCALSWMLCGVLVMRQMINFKV